MRLEEQRILAGSLNLLTPSDKTPENDAIVLENVRVDQAEVLRAADSFAVLTNFGFGPLHSIFKLEDYITNQANTSGTIRVAFGAATSGAALGITGGFLVGVGTGWYFYWPQSGAVTVLESLGSLSGNPLSVVLWNGFVWLLDSLKQLKWNPAVQIGESSGATLTAWLPPPPSTRITATDAPTYRGQMTDTSIYRYFVQFFGPPYTGAGVSPVGPNSPAVSSVNGVVSLSDIPTSGAPQIVSLYRSGGSLPHPCLVAVFSNGWYPVGGLPLGYYAWDGSFVDGFSDATLIAAGLSPAPASGSNPAPTFAPTVLGGFVGSGGAITGETFTYYATFVTDAGLETNAGPVSLPVTATENAITLTTIPVSPDVSVVRRRIYRAGGTLGNAYQVVEIADNSTDHYTDTQTDLQLTETGIVMPTTNDPPPTGNASESMGVVGPYFNTLLAWKGAKLFWSQNGVPLFPGSADGAAIGNWANVGSPDDQIVAITLHPQVAIIYKQRSIWRLFGDPVTGVLANSASTCGAIGKKAVANCGSYDMFEASDGVYRFVGDSSASIGDKIAPVFMGKQWIGLGASDLLQPAWGTPQYPFCDFMNGTAILGNGGAYAGDINGTAFLYHPASERWARFFSSANPAVGSITLTAALSVDNQFQWFAGDAAGRLLVSQQIAGTFNSFVWQTRFLDQGMGDEPKHYQEVVVDAELNGGAMTVWLIFDNSTAAPALATVVAPYTATFIGTSRKKFYMPLPQSVGANLQYRISVRVQIVPITGSIPPAIHGLYIYYAAEERDAAIRGTQPLDFHDERIQLCQRMEVDAVGQVTLEIVTDEPNGLALRYTFAGPATGRAIYEFKLPPNVRGRLWRIDVLPQGASGTARVYGVRGWMRAIGTAQAEVWQWKDFLRGVEAELPDAE